MIKLHIKIIHPPSEGQTAREIENITVGLLDSASVGDILELEQILNRITDTRFHVEVDKP